MEMIYLYVEVPRTEGISSTDLLYRIIQAFKESKSKDVELDYGFNSVSCTPISSYTSGITKYTPNILRIAQFSSSTNGHTVDTLPTGSIDGIRPPNPGERIVYVPGAFDLMHVGHVKFLEKCRELGTYIIVGLHSDETAALESGRIGPILKMEERYLSLLAIRYVNNVISNAPLVITNELLDFFAVDFVAVGLHTDDNWEAEHDPFKIPRARGIFRHVDSGSDVTTRQVIKRIISNSISFFSFYYSAYADRNRLKEAREAEAIARSTANNSVENF
nr:Rossmann alpha beta alpha sandwich fold [Hymenolepis microstoma]